MKTLTLIGAGGKMGCRITNNVKNSDWRVFYVEAAPAGKQRLKDCGVICTEVEEALPLADVVIFAVPDVAMEAVTRAMIPQLKPSALVILLDPAAPLDGKIAHRDDLGYFIAHPCHPSVFNWEPTEDGFREFLWRYFRKTGGGMRAHARDEKYYGIGVEVTRLIYQPVVRIHRVTCRTDGHFGTRTGRNAGSELHGNREGRV